jgi:hypothetical protein
MEYLNRYLQTVDQVHANRSWHLLCAAGLGCRHREQGIERSDVRVGVKLPRSLYKALVPDVVGRAGCCGMGCLRVEVEDGGAGLSEEEQRKIFGEFTQFNKNEVRGGDY